MESVEAVAPADMAAILSVLTGVSREEMIIEVKVNENGEIVSVIVCVKDMMEAIMIMEGVNGLERGSACNGGILCRNVIARMETANVEVLSTFVEEGSFAMLSMMTMIVSFLSMITFNDMH